MTKPVKRLAGIIGVAILLGCSSSSSPAPANDGGGDSVGSDDTAVGDTGEIDSGQFGDTTSCRLAGSFCGDDPSSCCSGASCVAGDGGQKFCK